MQNTFISDAIKVWNKAPQPIKTAKTVEGAKKRSGHIAESYQSSSLKYPKKQIQVKIQDLENLNLIMYFLFIY